MPYILHTYQKIVARYDVQWQLEISQNWQKIQFKKWENAFNQFQSYIQFCFGIHAGPSQGLKISQNHFCKNNWKYVIDKIMQKKIWVAVIIYIDLWCPKAYYCLCSKIISSRPSAGTWKFRIGSIYCLQQQVITFSDIKIYSLKDLVIFAAFFLLQHHLIDLTNWYQFHYYSKLYYW